MARRVGIRCPKFAIGFGPRVFSFDYRGTEFSICLLPLGGYVMMLGEDPDNDDAESEFKLVSSYLPEGVLPAGRAEVVKALEAKQAEVAEDEQAQFRSVLGHVRFLPDAQYETVRQLEGNFNDKTIPQRMAVVLGGVTMNFISAILLFWFIGSVYGLVDLSPNSLPVVMKVFNNSPAAAAGIAYGDRVEAIDGKTVVSGSDMIRAIGMHPGEKVAVTVKRGDQLLNLSIVPNVLIGGITFHPDSTVDDLPQVVSVNAFGENMAANGLVAGDVVEKINDTPVRSLSDLIAACNSLSQTDVAPGKEVEKVTVKFGLKGKDSVSIALAAPDWRPVGKMGIMPAQVTEFKFIDKTTNAVVAVQAGSLAAKSGFRAGDVLYLVNGARIVDADSLDKVLASLDANAEKQPSLVFDLARNEEHVQLQVEGSAASSEAMGLTMEPITFGLVVRNSFVLIGRLIIAPVIIIQQLADKMLSPDLVKASMSGPLGIMQMIFELSDDGLGKFLYIVALINAAVGAFNVIPFPALDGARWLVLLIGAIRGRELDSRKEAMVHQYGLYILLAFVLFVTFLDIQRMWFGVPLTK